MLLATGSPLAGCCWLCYAQHYGSPEALTPLPSAQVENRDHILTEARQCCSVHSMVFLQCKNLFSRLRPLGWLLKTRTRFWAFVPAEYQLTCSCGTSPRAVEVRKKIALAHMLKFTFRVCLVGVFSRPHAHSAGWQNRRGPTVSVHTIGLLRACSCLCLLCVRCLFQVSKSSFYSELTAPHEGSSSSTLLFCWRQIKQIYSYLTEAIELLKQIDPT